MFFLNEAITYSSTDKIMLHTSESQQKYWIACCGLVVHLTIGMRKVFTSK